MVMGKGQFINALNEGVRVDDVFSIRLKKPVRQTNSGSFFFELRVGDGTGEIALKYWGGKREDAVQKVFESAAKLDAFGAKLMPILKEMGIEAKPTVLEVYNIIEGK